MSRRLLSRLRDMLAAGTTSLADIVSLVAAEMAAEVCSIYVQRPGDILELAATEGLNPCAVGLTRLRVGEGIVGLSAATATVLNLPDAQSHPSFADRPETGEEPFASMLAVPVRRSGRTLGVLVLQNREPRLFSETEVDELETITLMLAETLQAAGATDRAPGGVVETVPRVFAGTALMGGIALGPVVLHGVRPVGVRVIADDTDAELARLHKAAQRMQRGLDELIAGAPQGGRGNDATASREVLEAYRLIATDAGWLRRVGEAVRSGLTAEAAVQRVAGELHRRMRGIGDSYLRERLADMEDLAGRLLNTLIGGAPRPEFPPGAILLARRLGPAELLDWHAGGIAGVAIEEASPAGHAAILARALGIPAIGGVRGMLDTAEAGDEVVVDADEGQVVLRPEADLRQAYARALEARGVQHAGWAELRRRPSASKDGVKLRLMLNVGLNLELDQLDRTGADGIGLFRTEIAMLARGAISDMPEQAADYARVLDAAGDRPVLFRTLDLGADKLLPGMTAGEENPAMGWRSLRVGLDRPALLRRQLRALLLAAAGRPLSVMFPMVATVAEFRAARSLLQAEAKRVRPSPERLSVGSMFEVPALFWQLRELLAEVDFVSIGSNDLMQFMFAADRGTPSLYGRYDLLSPAVLDMIEQLVRAAEVAGVPVSLCGEAASRPLEAMVLASIGVTSLSMSAGALLPVKALLAEVDLATFRPVLAAIRRGTHGVDSMRDPILAWAREHNLSL